MDYSYYQTPERVAKQFNTSVTNGLEPNEVLKNRVLYGSNIFPKKKMSSFLSLFIEQFKDLMIFILFFSAFISFLLSYLETSSFNFSSLTEPLVIFAIIIINAFIGALQESNAEKSIEELKEFEQPNAFVIRAGENLKLESTELVCGDLVELTTGYKVPADCRIVSINTGSFAIDESLLTGEVEPVEKSYKKINSKKINNSNSSQTGSETYVELVNQEKNNIAFGGTLVVRGNAMGIVVNVGLKTEIGKIRDALITSDEIAFRTPLQQKLDEFAKSLSLAILGICIFVWIFNIKHFSEGEFKGNFMYGGIHYFKIAVALAVAAIPEGLPAVITTCLALGSKRMASKKAIIRSLPSAETLGCTSVICSDKTGTLTTNKMAVKYLVGFEFCSEKDRRKNLSAKKVEDANKPILKGIEIEGEDYNFENKKLYPFSSTNNFKKEENDGIKGEILKKGNENKNFVNEEVSKNFKDFLFELVEIGAVCNTAKLENKEGKIGISVGEPTEAALLCLAEKVFNQLEKSEDSQKGNFFEAKSHFDKKFENMATLEFSRDRKSMSTLVKRNNLNNGFIDNDFSNYLFVKGAPESLIYRCSHVSPFFSQALESKSRRKKISNLNEDGVEQNRDKIKLTDELRKQILEQLEINFSSKGLRCILLAKKSVTERQARSVQKTVKSSKSTSDELADYESIETNLVLWGIAALQDPPRSEVKEALRICKEAGIKVIVLTGDNKITANSICKQIGLISQDESKKEICMDGKEFFSKINMSKFENGKSFKKLERKQKSHKVLNENSEYNSSLNSRETNDEYCFSNSDIKNLKLLSRVEPRHKMDLVKMLQKENFVVAMTGDGVNDAPALKAADIGVSMGGGTEVAREASDMILLDDNFNTIVKAVEEGRLIYNNMKLFIRYLISSNIGEVLIIFIANLLGLPTIFKPIQLLWVNLVTDGLPATALSFNKRTSGLMKEKPRSRNENLVSRRDLIRFLIIGAYVSIATVGVYVYEFKRAGLSLGQISLHFNCPKHNEVGNISLNEMEGNLNHSDEIAKVCGVIQGSKASTMALSVLVVIEMFNAFNALSENESLFKVGFFSNTYLIFAVLASLILHVLLVYNDTLKKIFGLAEIGFNDWVIVIGASFPIFFVEELIKLFLRRFKND